MHQVLYMDMDMDMDMYINININININLTLATWSKSADMRERRYHKTGNNPQAVCCVPNDGDSLHAGTVHSCKAWNCNTICKAEKERAKKRPLPAMPRPAFGS